MIGLLYLPVLAAIHFSSGTALGAMAVLSAKALCDMRGQDRTTCRMQRGSAPHPARG